MRLRHLAAALTALLLISVVSAKPQQAERAAKQPTVATLGSHSLWKGQRVYVAAIANGKPVIQPRSKWSLDVQRDGPWLRVKGFDFGVSVWIDPTKARLRIADVDFATRPVSGVSPLFSARFIGFAFEQQDKGARCFGKGSVLALDDGRIAFDFDKLFLLGQRCREYGWVRAVPKKKDPRYGDRVLRDW